MYKKTFTNPEDYILAINTAIYNQDYNKKTFVLKDKEELYLQDSYIQWMHFAKVYCSFSIERHYLCMHIHLLGENKPLYKTMIDCKEIKSKTDPLYMDYMYILKYGLIFLDSPLQTKDIKDNIFYSYFQKSLSY